MNEEWIDLSDSLPAIGRRVQVKGRHTAVYRCLVGHYPIASRRRASCLQFRQPVSSLTADWSWESSDWRGAVGITHWREMEQNENVSHLTVQVAFVRSALDSQRGLGTLTNSG